jgi:hypothetical protein
VKRLEGFYEGRARNRDMSSRYQLNWCSIICAALGTNARIIWMQSAASGGYNERMCRCVSVRKKMKSWVPSIPQLFGGHDDLRGQSPYSPQSFNPRGIPEKHIWEILTWPLQHLRILTLQHKSQKSTHISPQNLQHPQPINCPNQVAHRRH